MVAEWIQAAKINRIEVSHSPRMGIRYSGRDPDQDIQLAAILHPQQNLDLSKEILRSASDHFKQTVFALKNIPAWIYGLVNEMNAQEQSTEPNLQVALVLDRRSTRYIEERNFTFYE